jgi:hypothetical protein
VTLAGIVEILEQLVPRKIATGFNDARKARIIDVAFVARPAFAAKAELDMVSLDLGMSVAQGGQTEASVRSGIFAIAYTKEGQF